MTPSGNVKCQNFWESARRERGGDRVEGQAATAAAAAGKLLWAASGCAGGRSLQKRRSVMRNKAFCLSCPFYFTWGQQRATTEPFTLTH